MYGCYELKYVESRSLKGIIYVITSQESWHRLKTIDNDDADDAAAADDDDDDAESLLWIRWRTK